MYVVVGQSALEKSIEKWFLFDTSSFLQGKIHPVIPFAVMSGFAFAAGCLCGVLPETLGRPTLETLEDAPEISSQHKGDASEQPLTTSV